MSWPAVTRPPGRSDLWLAAAASAAVGAAGAVAISGAATGSLPTLGVAAGLAAAGAGALLAAGWVELLLVLAVSLPLPALYATDEARLSPVLPVTALVLAAWFVSAGPGLGREWARGAPVRGMAVLFAAVAVASGFADAPVAALRETVNFALLLGLLLVAVDVVAQRPVRAAAVARTLALVSAGAGVAALMEALGFLPGRFPLAGSTLFRAAGGFGWPNELGMFLAVTLPFAVYGVRTAATAPTRVLFAVALGLSGLGLASTFSRGSWLAVALAPAVLPLVGEGRAALRLWGAGALAVVGLDLVTGGLLSARVVSTTGDVLVAQRLLLMAAGFLMFQAHPVVGVGPGGFGDALDRFGLQVSGLFDFVGSAHNGYVHMAAEAGAVGLGALLYFVGTTLAALARGLWGPRPAAPPAAERDRRALRVAFLWSFATACLVTLFEWPFAHGVGELIVLVAGAGMALAPPKAGPS